MTYTDPRGPMRKIVNVEERTDVILLTFECGCIGQIVPHRRGAYRVNEDAHAFGCKHVPMTDEENTARNKGYSAGLMGEPSKPADFMNSETLRRAYEAGYDIGRAARLSEQG